MPELGPGTQLPGKPDNPSLYLLSGNTGKGNKILAFLRRLCVIRHGVNHWKTSSLCRFL